MDTYQFLCRQLVSSPCNRSRKMTSKKTNIFIYNHIKPTEDISLLVWIVRQLIKYAHFRGWRDPERIKAATKKLEEVLEKKCTSQTLKHPIEEDGGYSRFCDQDELFNQHEGFGTDKWRVPIFKKGHKSLG